MLTGGMLAAALEHARLGLLIWLAIVVVVLLVVHTTAQGREDLFDDETWSELPRVLAGVPRFAGALLLGLSPFLVYATLLRAVFGGPDHGDELGGIAGWLLLSPALAWAPLAAMEAMTDVPARSLLDPWAAQKRARAVGGDYALAAACVWLLVAGAAGVGWLAAPARAVFLEENFLPTVVVASMQAYPLLAAARVLGLLLRARKPELGLGEASDRFVPILGDVQPAVDGGRPARAPGEPTPSPRHLPGFEPTPAPGVRSREITLPPGTVATAARIASSLEFTPRSEPTPRPSPHEGPFPMPELPPLGTPPPAPAGARGGESVSAVPPTLPELSPLTPPSSPPGGPAATPSSGSFPALSTLPGTKPSEEQVIACARAGRYEEASLGYRARKGAVRGLTAEELGEIARSAAERSDLMTAAHALRRSGLDHPREPGAADALLESARLLRDCLDQPAEAARLLRTIVERYPALAAAEDARAVLAHDAASSG